MQKKLLNLYPQEAWHDEIFIAANLSAMNSLYTSFKSLANSNNDEYFELTDSDFYSSENINTKIVFKIIPYSEFKKLSSTYFGKGFDYLQQDELTKPWEPISIPEKYSPLPQDSFFSKSYPFSIDTDRGNNFCNIYPSYFSQNNNQQNVIYFIGNKRTFCTLKDIIEIEIDFYTNKINQDVNFEYTPATLIPNDGEAYNALFQTVPNELFFLF